MFPPLGQSYREKHRGKGASGSCYRKHIPLLATLLQYRPRIFHTTRFILERSTFFAIHPTNFTSSQPMVSPIFFNTLEVITEGRKEVRALLELHFLICRVSSKEYQKRLSETHSGSFKKKKCFCFLQTYLSLWRRLCAYILGSLTGNIKICACP